MVLLGQGAGGQVCPLVLPDGAPDFLDPVGLPLLPCVPGGRNCISSVLNCCANPPVTNIPTPANINQGATYACFLNCNEAAQQTVATVVVNNVAATSLCDHYTATVSFTVGSTTFSGTMILHYARTWKLILGNTPGQGLLQGQVWRWLVNADVTSTGGSSPCPLPPCYDQPIHFVGHIDYACIQAEGQSWTAALSLSHLPGCISHNAASVRPLTPPADHQDRSYHLVSPSTNWTWFSPVGGAPPSGFLFGDTMRETTLTPSLCWTESAVVSQDTQLMAQEPFCLCNVPQTGNHGWWDMGLGGQGDPACNPPLSSQFSATQTGCFQTGSASGLVGLVLGTWANPNLFPYNTTLSIFWGCLDHEKPCSGTKATEFVTGVATDLLEGPFSQELFPNQPNVCCVMLPAFVDLHTSKIQVAGSWVNLWGALFWSDYVLSLNPR